MNERRTIQRAAVALLLGGLLLGGGCGGSGRLQTPDVPVVGSWERAFEGRTITLVLDTGMNYSVDVDGKPGKDAWGRYTIEDGRLTFLDEKGHRASDSGGAIYSFTILDDRMELRAIDDPDPTRSAVAEATWTRS